jgi:DNA-binding Lrp family transcriptional regulator
MNVEHYFKERAQDIFFLCYEDLARTMGGGNKALIMSVLINRNKQFQQKYNADNYFYLKYSYIEKATGASSSAVKRTLKTLEEQGLISRKTSYEKTGKGDKNPFNKRVYIKINYEILNKAKMEDMNNEHMYTSNYTQYLKKCPTIKKIRKGENLIKNSKKPTESNETYPPESNETILSISGGNETYLPGGNVSTPYNNIKEENNIKATINSCTTLPIATAQAEVEHVSQVASESIRGEVSLLNSNEDKSNENPNESSLVTSNNNSNPSSPCLINNKDSSEVFPCYLDNNLISAPPTPQNSDSAAKCGPDGGVDVSVEGGELASGSCRIDSNSKFDLVPHSDTKTQNHPQKNNHILNPQNLFKSGKGSKKEETMAELTKLRETDPKFMRIYDAWVEQGFPAHKPNTAVFREAKKVIPQILDGTFFEDKADVDGYSRVFSVREIIKAIKNFKLAFDVNYEPANKNWLKKRKNLAKFFFDPMLHTKSLFIEFLEEPKLIEPATKSPEAKYLEKYRKKYVYMPDWFKPLYDIYAEDGRMIPEEEFTEEQNKWGIAYYFNHFMLDFEEDDEGLAFGELPFGWSDMEILVSLWRERDGVTDEEFEYDPNLMGSWEDVFYAIQSRVNEMGSKMTRSHLFSEKVWKMVYEE